MQEKILKVISDSEKRGLSIEEIKDKLSLNTEKEYDETWTILNNLIKTYVLVLNRKARYMLATYDCIYFGMIRLNKKGFGFVSVESLAEDVYINASDLHGALDQDEVVIKYEPVGNNGIVMGILKHGIKYLVGSVLMNKKGRFKLEVDSSKIAQPIFIDENTNNLVEGLKVKVEIIDYQKAALITRLESIIGHIQDPGVDVLAKLMEYDIEPQFNQMVMHYVDQVPNTVLPEDLEGRTDLRDIFTCTIDGDDSKDFDDAISFKKLKDGYELGAHIADVSYYVSENSLLDIEAYNRGTSVYVVDRVVPMLPFKLSNGICSLNPGVDRLTISCTMKYDLNGEIVDYSIYPSLIKSKLRMTYNNVNKILNKDLEICDTYKEYLDIFNGMHELSLLIRKLRKARGCIDFDTTESKFKLDEFGKIIDVYARERYEAEAIIEDFMISANECVAKHMKFLELPFIYRIHEDPNPTKVREFGSIAKILGYGFAGNPNSIYVREFQKLLESAKNSEAFPVLSTFMLRCMSKARYDVNCVGHFGLASENYTHFTSPIRRYPDLIVHRQLRKYLFNKNVPDPEMIKNDFIKMEDIALQTSSKERNAVEAERDVESMKKAEFFESKIGEKYDGIVTSINNFGMFIQLDNTVEGLVHISNMHDDYYHFDKMLQTLIGERTHQTYRLGQKVKIKVKNASKSAMTIDFEIVTKSENNFSEGTFKRHNSNHKEPHKVFKPSTFTKSSKALGTNKPSDTKRIADPNKKFDENKKAKTNKQVKSDVPFYDTFTNKRHKNKNGAVRSVRTKK